MDVQLTTQLAVNERAQKSAEYRAPIIVVVEKQLSKEEADT